MKKQQTFRRRLKVFILVGQKVFFSIAFYRRKMTEF